MSDDSLVNKVHNLTRNIKVLKQILSDRIENNMLDENHEDLDEKLGQLLNSKSNKNVKTPSKVTQTISKSEDLQFEFSIKPESQINTESASKSTKKRTVMQKLKSITKSKNN